MSFFDDGDPPTRARSTPRPPARPRQPSGGARRPSHAPATSDELRNRRIGLIAGGIVLVLLFGFLVNSCMSSAKKRAMKDYNRQVTALVQRSDDNSEQLFAALSGGGDNQTTNVNQIRVEADDVAKRAEALDVPDEMKPAQRNLLLALNLRAGAIGKIGTLLPAANGNDASAFTAMEKIAGQMRAFLASDVIYSQRVIPLINEAFLDQDITGQKITPSTFLESDGWLSTNKVAARINPNATEGSRGGGEPTPGTHGHGIVSTSIGSVQLDPAATANRIPIAAGAKPVVDITFANQGENNETDVKVTLEIATGGGKPQAIRKTVPSTKAGTEIKTSIAFTTAPAPGQAFKLTVTVAKVPGEEKVDNNKASYNVLFTSG